MSRNFPDFISAYLNQTKNEFVPDKFQTWTAISLVAAALERRVWTYQTDDYTYPNLYTIFVSEPGEGKSKSSGFGVDHFLRKLKKTSPSGGDYMLNFLGTQNTEKAIAKDLEKFQCFTYRRFDGAYRDLTQSSHFFYASELASSLKALHSGGDLIPLLTDMYDCPKSFSRNLSDVSIRSDFPCINMFGCCTFSYLKQLLGGDNAAGGFASRLIFIIHPGETVKYPTWNESEANEEPPERLRLLADLNEIYQLSGQFKTTKAFHDYWAEWMPKQQIHRIAQKSEFVKQLLKRRHANVLKVAQVVSVSENAFPVLDVTHWQRAEEFMKESYDNVTAMASGAVDRKTPRGLTHFALKALSDAGGFLFDDQLTEVLLQQNLDIGPIQLTQWIRGSLIVAEKRGNRTGYKLLGNPNDYL